MITIAFSSRFHDYDVWSRMLRERLPELNFVAWPPAEPDSVAALLCWDLPNGASHLPNLKFIQCLGAGVDHLLANPETPKNIPIARLVHVDQIGGLVHYISASILSWHRQLPQYRSRQENKVWAPLPRIPAGDRNVGIMGLGKFGLAIAREMQRLGFRVRGLSRSGQPIEGMQVFSMEDIGCFASELNAIVCVLPLTPQTEAILSKKLFERMADGAHLINVGRGEHLNEHDLIEAFSSGRIASASLDVFRTEPLPEDNPLWGIPGLEITPHIATSVRLETAIEIVERNLRAVLIGAELSDLVDRTAGY